MGVENLNAENRNFLSSVFDTVAFAYMPKSDNDMKPEVAWTAGRISSEFFRTSSVAQTGTPEEVDAQISRLIKAVAGPLDHRLIVAAAEARSIQLSMFARATTEQKAGLGSYSNGVI